MKHIYYLLTCFIVLSYGCRRDGSDNTSQVHKRLHGKYKVISAVTNTVVDVNMDGTAGNDLLAEMEYVTYCDLVVRIVDKNHFYFEQFWSEQFLTYGNAPPVINFACQGALRTFTLGGDNVTLQLQRDDIIPPDPNLWTFPDAVTIEGNDLIKVVLTKKLYTASGWQTVTITALYQRYTTLT